MQMPSTANESSHALMRMVAAEGPWSSRLVPVAKTQPLIAAFDDYYEWLHPFSSAIEVWMTTYVYTFDSAAGVADFFAGSALQPFLERLSDDERCDFVKPLSGGAAGSLSGAVGREGSAPPSAPVPGRGAPIDGRRSAMAPCDCFGAYQAS